MRGPSSPQTTFAMESHMDDLAHAIGMDPLDFRLKNLLEAGEKTGVGQTLVDVDYKKVVRTAADAIGWKKIKKEKNIGKGSLKLKDFARAQKFLIWEKNTSQIAG